MAKTPSARIPVKVNQVAKGKGAVLGADGSGRNKPAPLAGTGIAKGQSHSKGMKLNDGHNSPIGKTRPTQDGGPRTAQTKGVDFSISATNSKKGWARTSKDG